MKNLLMLSGRTVVILLAALLVVWVTMSLVDTSATGRFPDRERGDFAQTNETVGGADERTDNATQGTEGRPQRGERHGPREQSLGGRLAFGLFGLVKNSAIIGIVVLIVLGIERFFIRRHPSSLSERVEQR